jgi:hypothetical protein
MAVCDSPAISVTLRDDTDDTTTYLPPAYELALSCVLSFPTQPKVGGSSAGSSSLNCQGSDSLPPTFHARREGIHAVLRKKPVFSEFQQLKVEPKKAAITLSQECCYLLKIHGNASDADFYKGRSKYEAKPL